MQEIRCIYCLYRSLELMSLRKSLTAFGRATLNRSLVIATRHHRVQALHPTKTNTEDESVDSREYVSYSNKTSIDFEQTKEAYKSKTFLSYLEAWWFSNCAPMTSWLRRIKRYVVYLMLI